MVLMPISKNIGLVDKPNYRKNHNGDIPLVGGVSMFSGITIGIYILQLDMILILPLAIVTIMGAVDDFIGISFKFRFAVQIMAIIILFKYFATPVNSLGDILSQGNVVTLEWAIFFTIFASIGVVNSFNFSDGIDGLAGGLALVTLMSIILLSHLKGLMHLVPFVVLVVSAIVPYLFFNLYCANCNSKIFMGDSGSMLIGLVLAYSLIHFSQDGSMIFSPVTALWIYALPLIDTVSIMLRRVIHKKSPFKPDRQHLHHFFQRLGYSDKKTLLILILISIVCATIGLLSDFFHVAEWKMFVLFIAVFFIYFYFILHAWRLTVLLKNH
jgi:UDP-GlcNAc:undecaprenyl-phosphate GlcNAc-1-phosphate transferase